MTTIAGMFRKFERLNLKGQVPVILNDTKRSIIDLNRSQLYQFGMRSDGIKLREYKSRTYAAKKNAINPQPGFGIPDLSSTGRFQSQFVVEVNNSGFTVNSKDSKSVRLVKIYGEEIYGLTRDNRKIYALGVFYTGVKEYVTLVTGLGFR